MITLGVLNDIFAYVKNGLPKLSFSEIMFFGALLVGFSKGVETLFGKKYIGTWVISGIGRFFSSPYTMIRSIEEMKGEMKTIRAELTFNGGGSMKDAVVATRTIAENTNNIVKDMKLQMAIADDIDNMLKFDTDDTGYWLWANRAFYNYFNLKESDVKGFNFETYIDKRDLQDVQVRWTRCIQTKSDFTYTYGIVNRDGDVIQCKVEGIPMLDNGALRGYKGIITPITENDR